MDMKKELNIRCRDLGVDHDGFVSGDSLESLVSCVEQQLNEQGVRPNTKESARRMKDVVRSALLQASRPARYRSANLSHLAEAI